MRAVRREPRKGGIPMTALSQGWSVSAAYGRTLRLPRGVVSNRRKYMGNASLDIPVAYQSMVEHAAVNRGVVGSSPTRGVKPVNIRVCGLFV